MSKEFKEGLRDGFPIGLGYFAVSFTLGIAMKNAGLTWFQGMVTSLLNNASAGEYAGISMIAAHAMLMETALVTMIANARYLLMSFALGQKISDSTSIWHRMLIGFDITDELFGIAISRDGYLNPSYYYGAMCISIPGWAIGTALGVISGNILPARIVAALSVALYGMFLAVIMPAAKKNRFILLLIIVSFICSFIASQTTLLQGLSEGTKTILLTVGIASIAAFIKPHEEVKS